MESSRNAVLVLALILILSGSAFAGEPDVFNNPTAGFQVTKPAAWHYLTAAENLENIKDLKLKDEDFQTLMAKYATAPLVAMAKFPEPYDDLNPSFKVNIKPFGQLKGMKPVELIGLIASQLEPVFADFELVQPPLEVVVSDIKSGYVRINYTVEAPDGTSYPTTSELWIVPRGDYFFMLGVGTRQDEKSGSRKEIEAIIKSVKIEP
jgi:hypothetical protein